MEGEQEERKYELEKIFTTRGNIVIFDYKFPDSYKLAAHLKENDGTTGKKVREGRYSVDEHVKKMKGLFEMKLSTRIKIPSLLEFELEDSGLITAGLHALTPHGFFGENAAPLDKNRANFLFWIGIHREIFFRVFCEEDFDLFMHNYDSIEERNFELKRLRRKLASEKETK